MPRRHDLKCWPGPFEATWDLRKTFEYRKDDRGFEVGDELLLREWDPTRKTAGHGSARKHTGRWCLVRVTYLLCGRFDVPAGYCVMSIEHVTHGDYADAVPDPALEQPPDDYDDALADPALAQLDEPALDPRPADGEAVEHWNKLQNRWEPAKVVYTFGDELIRLETVDEDGTPKETVVRLSDEQYGPVGTWRRLQKPLAP